MSTQSALQEDDPRMIAWNAYKQTEAFKNSKHWALRVAPMFQAGEARDATHDLMPIDQRTRHVEGSLWAAFHAGYNAARGITE